MERLSIMFILLDSTSRERHLNLSPESCVDNRVPQLPQTCQCPLTSPSPYKGQCFVCVSYTSRSTCWVERSIAAQKK